LKKQSRLTKIRSDLDLFGDAGKAIWDLGLKLKDEDERIAYYSGKLYEFAVKTEEAMKYRNGKPVSFEEFMTSKDYADFKGEIWPEVMKASKELNSGKYVEAVLTGGIGVAKTTIAVWTTAYQLYILSCHKNPHGEFGIGPQDEIVFIIQSLNKSLARDLDYKRMRNFIEASPYFQNHFMFNKEIESEMRFPLNIVVKPVSGETTAAIGQNVFGGILDEVNFMNVIEKSKQSKDGETFDQAQELYRAIARRRESRFMKQGTLPGMLCLVSSKQYPEEFTDKKIQEARAQELKTGVTNIFIYDKRVWEVAPEGKYTKERFYVFIGDSTRQPRILRPGEKLSEDDAHLILGVPLEYKSRFEVDLLANLRDVAGVATLALHPFILNRQKLVQIFGRTTSVLSRGECDFAETSIQVYPKAFRNIKKSRFVHLDLATTGDCAGIACGYVRQFIEIQRSPTETEILPEIVFDFILGVKPPRNGEINFSKIRQLLYTCRDMGLPIKWVSMDTFQSTDTRQILASNGFITGIRSVDRDTRPYDMTKSAIMDGRLLVPSHPRCQRELTHLEKNTKKQHVDHPPNGSKDCSDAMAGVVYGLSTQRDVWAEFGIPMMRIPFSEKGKGQ